MNCRQGGVLKHEAMEVVQQRLGADELGEHGMTRSANSSCFGLDAFVALSCVHPEGMNEATWGCGPAIS